jgi:hypothetical protein
MSTTCHLPESELLEGTMTQQVFLRLTPIIIGVGLLGNILNICIFILTDLKRQPVSILTIALAFVDSVVLLVPVFLLWLEKLLRQEWTDLSAFWCRTHGTFRSDAASNRAFHFP